MSTCGTVSRTCKKLQAVHEQAVTNSHERQRRGTADPDLPGSLRSTTITSGLLSRGPRVPPGPSGTHDCQRFLKFLCSESSDATRLKLRGLSHFAVGSSERSYASAGAPRPRGARSGPASSRGAPRSICRYICVERHRSRGRRVLLQGGRQRRSTAPKVTFDGQQHQYENEHSH